MREQRVALILLFVFCFTLVSFRDVNRVEANPFTNVPLPSPAFTIKGDGNVDPSTAPIHRDGDVYTLTDDIVGYTIIVQKDNITLDGGGYTLRGYGSEGNFSLKGYADPTGILVMSHDGVTVRNMKISGFSYGIHITALSTLVCKNIVIENNLVEENYYGVSLSRSWYTVLRNNHLNNNVRNLYVHDLYSMLPPAPEIYVNDIDSSNTINGKPIVYWVNEQNKTVPSDAGYIALIKCTNITVQNLDIADNGQGILLVSTTNSLISNNHVTNTNTGIFAHNSSNIVITENNLESNGIGLSIRRLSNSSISVNNFAQSGSGASLVSSQNNVVSGNSISRNKGNGMSLNGFDNNTLEQNIIAENEEDGVSVLNSHNNRIAGNIIANNGYYGVKIWEDSIGNMVLENLVTNHTVGIRIQGCANNSIIGNTIAENKGLGLQLAGTNNVIYHNNFLHNQEEEWDTQVSVTREKNVWDNGTAGNYWSNYNGTDSDGDGIGDTPIHISNDNIDHYPLMKPVEIPEVPTYYELPEYPSWIILPIFMIATLMAVTIYRRLLTKTKNTNHISLLIKVHC